MFGGEKVVKGQILVRQRGNNFSKGVGVKEGRDHSLYSIADGVATYSKKLGKRSNPNRNKSASTQPSSAAWCDNPRKPG